MGHLLKSFPIFIYKTASSILTLRRNFRESYFPQRGGDLRNFFESPIEKRYTSSFILFHTIIYSCNSSEEQTFEEMLRRDSVELSQMIQRASESKIEHLFVFSGRYESGSKPQCFEILRKLSNSRSLRFEGSLNYWDDITIDAVYADSIENTFIDSLNIENDLKSLFKSCKKIIW